MMAALVRFFVLVRSFVSTNLLENFVSEVALVLFLFRHRKYTCRIGGKRKGDYTLCKMQ